jgi:hypothetical protein
MVWPLFEFLKRMIASTSQTPGHNAVRAEMETRSASSGRHQDSPEDGFVRAETKSVRDEDVTRRYFELSVSIEKAKQRGDYRAAIAYARETFPLLKRFVAACIKEYGRWDIVTSHAVHTAGPLMAVEEDRVAIADLRATLQKIPELSAWLSIADQAEEDLVIVQRIKAVVNERPGVHQTDLKKVTGHSDGRRLSVLVGYLERGGHLRKVRTDKTYELYVGDSAPLTSRTDKPTTMTSKSEPATDSSRSSISITTPTSWQRRAPMRPQELDLGRMRVLRLPVAPSAWEDGGKDIRDSDHSTKRTDEGPSFMVTGDGWVVADERKLAKDERPDMSFRHSYPGSRWTYWLDPRGRTARWPDAPSILRVTDSTGALISERGLPWDTYRSDINVDGSAILFLSRDGVLHGHDHGLDLILFARLQDLPEYQACAERLGIPEESLKNHVRCVAISTDRSRYVVTVVDEAWCLSVTGMVLWGLRFPTSERWAPVKRSLEQTGPTSQVMESLALLGLTLPVTPDDMTRAYRKRALEWHPDRNPGDPFAGRRMQELNAAMALLVGTDVSALTVPQIERVTSYEDITTRQTFTDPSSGISISMSINVGPLQAADWIYAANFGEGGRVYLASYSGRVVEVTTEGIPVAAFDLAAVPRHVAETPRYLYLLTDTRLYVLKGDEIVALLDVFDQGRLIVTDTGLGLLEQKAFTWLSPSGQFVGRVQSRDPIRRVMRITEGLAIESRQRRVLVHGTAPWWE